MGASRARRPAAEGRVLSEGLGRTATRPTRQVPPQAAELRGSDQQVEPPTRQRKRGTTVRRQPLLQAAAGETTTNLLAQFATNTDAVRSSCRHVLARHRRCGAIAHWRLACQASLSEPPELPAATSSCRFDGRLKGRWQAPRARKPAAQALRRERRQRGAIASCGMTARRVVVRPNVLVTGRTRSG